MDADRGHRIMECEDFRHVRDAEVFARKMSRRHEAPIREKIGCELRVYEFKAQY